MTVWLLQYLCPQRHAIMAAAYDDPSDRAHAEARILEWVRTLANPWCGICRSEELRFEEGRTRFVTVDEAEPALLAIGRGNALARALLGRF